MVSARRPKPQCSQRALEASGYKHPRVFSDPPNTILGNMVRQLITEMRMEPFSQLLLVTAARADNFKRFVKPILDQYRIVIYDRFIHSSLVYQSECHGLALTLHGQGQIRFPDKVFFLDMPIHDAHSRIDQPDVMEEVGWEKVRERREMFRNFSNSHRECELIDVSGLTKDQVSDKLYVKTMDFLKKQESKTKGGEV